MCYTLPTLNQLTTLLTERFTKISVTDSFHTLFPRHLAQLNFKLFLSESASYEWLTVSQYWRSIKNHQPKNLSEIRPIGPAFISDGHWHNVLQVLQPAQAAILSKTYRTEVCQIIAKLFPWKLMAFIQGKGLHRAHYN